MPNTCKQTQTNKVWKNWQPVEKDDTQPIFLRRIMNTTNTHTRTQTMYLYIGGTYVSMSVCVYI